MAHILHYAQISLFHISYLFIHLTTQLLIHFPHLSFALLPSRYSTLLLLLLFGPYLSFSRSLLIYPHPEPPFHPSQGSGHLIYRACLLHLSLHFPPPALTDRSPLSLRVHIDHGAWERDAGRERGGGRDRVHPQDSGRRADRWAKAHGGGEGRLWRACMDWKASLCWGCRGQADWSQSTRRKRRNWEFGWQLSLNLFLQVEPGIK